MLNCWFGFGGFGGLDSWYAPMKGIGILGGTRLESQSTGPQTNRPQTNNYPLAE